MARASARVMKMPAWAAAPKRNIFGLDSRGPKSIMAPTPMNSSRGNSSLAMPALNSASMPPVFTWGRFTRMVPKPMGSSRAGSIPRRMAR